MTCCTMKIAITYPIFCLLSVFQCRVPITKFFSDSRIFLCSRSWQSALKIGNTFPDEGQAIWRSVKVIVFNCTLNFLGVNRRQDNVVYVKLRPGIIVTLYWMSRLIMCSNPTLLVWSYKNVGCMTYNYWRYPWSFLQVRHQLSPLSPTLATSISLPCISCY